MLEILYKPCISMGTSLNIYAILSLFILTLFCSFGWYQWKLINALKQFPSKRLDAKWIVPIITTLFPKHTTRSIFQEVTNECKRFQDEGACVLWFGRPHLVIYSEEFTKTISNETAAINKGPLYYLFKDFMGNGLLGSKEETWKVHRKLINPAFHLGVLKGKMNIFNDSGVDLVEELQAFVGKPIENVLEIFKHSTFKVMAESVLHLDLNEINCGSKARDFRKNIDLATEFSVYRLLYPWLRWDFLLQLFPSGRKYIETIDEIRHFTCEVIEEIKKSIKASQEEEIHLESEEEVRKSFANILIKQHLNDSTFTVDDVRDHLINIMFGGFDTSSITLMWCFYLLGHHPEIQDKAYEEVESVIPVGDVTYDDLGQLKYLDSILKETLRLYPTVPFYSREAKREVQCGKYTVPKGVELVFSPFLLHRNPNIYPRPEKFDPERFSETSVIRPWTHIPFAEGIRSCIGKKFAMMEMKVLLVHVLRRFKITTLKKVDDSDLDWALVLKPTDPICVLFTNRHDLSLEDKAPEI